MENHWSANFVSKDYKFLMKPDSDFLSIWENPHNCCTFTLVIDNSCISSLGVCIMPIYKLCNLPFSIVRCNFALIFEFDLYSYVGQFTHKTVNFRRGPSPVSDDVLQNVLQNLILYFAGSLRTWLASQRHQFFPLESTLLTWRDLCNHGFYVCYVCYLS